MSNKLRKYNGNKANSTDIVIDDGSKTYTIKNKNGEVLSKFVFRPSDTNITQRYEEVRKFFEEFKAEDGMDPKSVEALFVEKFDYLVDADAKNTFFSIMGAFSPMPDGRPFFEVCMNAIGDVISKEFDIRMKKMQGRVSKYTQKYHV